MVRISRIVRAYPSCIPRNRFLLRAWQWLLPVAAVALIAATCTPIWAVKAGGVHYALESAGGLVVYLSADDGNAYYYAHMSEILGGGDRGVGQGEAIGR